MEGDCDREGILPAAAAAAAAASDLSADSDSGDTGSADEAAAAEEADEKDGVVATAEIDAEDAGVEEVAVG